MNILDYIDWRGDLSLAERPFNEVDNLLFAKLVYLSLEKGVAEGNQEIALEDLYTMVSNQPADLYLKNNDPRMLLEKMAQSKRFAKVTISRYVSDLDKEQEIQFAAAAYRLGDGTLYAAFRGTDISLVGWKEDFNMTYQGETPGQTAAVKYLMDLAADTTEPIRMGGHSKGGNFAEFAAMYAGEEIFNDRILEIYSNDGPGFLNAIIQTEEYERILPKVKKYVPESSVVGMLLCGKETLNIVKADGSGGVKQHNPYQWNVCCDHFVETEKRSVYSTIMEDVMDGWGDRLDDNEKRILIDALFEVFDASGSESLNDLNRHKISNAAAIMKAMRQLDPMIAREILLSLRKLAASGKDAVWNEAKEKAATGTRVVLQEARGLADRMRKKDETVQ